MKKRGLFTLMTVVCLCCTLLTGCIAGVFHVKINEDGSGNLSVSVGYTDEAIREIALASGATEDNLEEAVQEVKAALVPFTYKGVTYYGELQSLNFADLDMLSETFAVRSNGEDASEDSGEIRFSRNADGGISFLFEVTPETGDVDNIKAELQGGVAEGRLSDEDIETILANAVIIYEIAFPAPVKQISGPSAGISIAGNLLTMNLMEMNEGIEEAKKISYEFSTEAIDTVPIFADTAKEAWYYPAVKAMTEGGLINGMGDGTFAPDSSMTYAQFCQLLAKGVGAEVGEENGYWAGRAIRACVEAGYITDRGAVSAENYDVSITREAAISAMYLAKNEAAVDAAAVEIPDFADISEEYRENVLGAYRVGITSGVDENKTFLPKKNLSRAEVCQLFYNVAWVAAE